MDNGSGYSLNLNKAEIIVGVHNFYEEITTDGFLFKNRNTSIGHNLLSQWVDLFEFSKNFNIRLVTLDQVSDFEQLDVVLFLDRPDPNNRNVQEVFSRSKILKYLIIYENPMIHPGNWEAAYHDNFGRIFTWDDDLVDNVRYFKFNYATDLVERRPLMVSKEEFREKKLVSMISGAKLVNHPNSLYQRRLDIISWFQRFYPDEFDLWGKGWQSLGLPCYRGETSDKEATGSNYRFQFTLENAKGFKGYISEKIFDAFVSGAIPIYAGAPNVHEHIPEETYISLDKFSTLDELRSFLHSFSYDDYLEKLKNIDQFLNSSRFAQFSPRFFSERLVSFILRDLSETKNTNDRAARNELRIESQHFSGPVSQVKVANSWTPSDLIVVVPYGYEMEVFRRARKNWAKYASIFDSIEILFFRDSRDHALGEVFFEGKDLVVGTKCAFTSATEKIQGYSQSGIWSPQENFSVLFRNITLYHHLLRTRKTPFYLYHATVTSVVDFRGLAAATEVYKCEELLAGMPGRLANPALKGLTFVCGTNNLVSSDIVKAMTDRYKFGDGHTFFPNDVWQALALTDKPRKVLPFFTVESPQELHSFDEQLFRKKIRCALDLGYFHFRVKTQELRNINGMPATEKTVYRREDVDPILMDLIMEEICTYDFKPERVAALLGQLSLLTTNTSSLEFPAFAGEQFMRFKVPYPFNDNDISKFLPPSVAA